MEDYVADRQSPRERAPRNMKERSVTESYVADLRRVIAFRNQTGATELIGVWRDMRPHFSSRERNAQSVAKEVLEHAREETDRVHMFTARVAQWGGEQDFGPDSVTGRSQTQYDSSKELKKMRLEDRAAGRVPILESTSWLGGGNQTKRRMLKENPPVDDEYAKDKRELLKG